MYRSQESVNSKNLGHTNKSFASRIPASKTHFFKTLYDSLVRYYGGVSKADKELRCGNGALKEAFDTKRLSEHHAKKILDKFNEVKKIKNKAIK